MKDGTTTVTDAEKALGEMGAESVVPPEPATAPASESEAAKEEISREDAKGAEAGEKTGEEAEKTVFTPEQQRIFDTRLAREVAKRKTVEEKQEAALAEAAELKAKLSEAQGKVDERAAEVAERLRLDPSYLSESDRSLVLRANSLEEREEFLELHTDGIEGDDPKESRTSEQVRRELVQVRQELRKIGERANSAYDRAKQQMLADTSEGRKARQARERALAGAKATPTPKPAAAAGVRAEAAPGAPREEPRGMSEERFRKAGATREAAEAELARL